MSVEKEIGKIKRPPLYLWLTEFIRFFVDLGWYLMAKHKLAKSPRGDGHHVLVFPGFMAGDTSTRILRRHLDRLGYKAHGWELGRNLGGDAYYNKVFDRVGEVYKESNGQKISIIGWSLGGIYARQCAKKHPDMVRQIITLASPFSGILEPNNASWLYNLIAKDGGIKNLDQDIIKDLPEAPLVPSTFVYSKEDGIVSWKVCREYQLNDYRQNIQVKGCHIALGHNPSVLHLIADRLQYNQGNWKKFDPEAKKNKIFFFVNY